MIYPDSRFCFCRATGYARFAQNTLRPLVNIRALYLEGNRLIYIEPNALAHMRYLEELTLDNNLLTSFDVSLIGKWPALQHFSIANNPIAKMFVGTMADARRAAT